MIELFISLLISIYMRLVCGICVCVGESVSVFQLTVSHEGLKFNLKKGDSHS